MQSIPVTVRPLGDAAVLIELEVVANVETSRRVRALARRVVVAIAGEPGWGAPIPGGASLLIPVDPLEPGAAAATTRLTRLVDSWVEESGGVPAGGAPEDDEEDALVEIPVRYGGTGGPDLDQVAEATGLTRAEVIARHAAVTYTTLFLGFAPGFGYLGPLPAALSISRRTVPRTHVPAGSVAIAGGQTAVYPVDSPGGWWIIGRTTAILWDPRRVPPALLRPGLRVRFVPERGLP